MRENVFLTVKSYETPFKRRIKTEPRFLAHHTLTASELLNLSFFRSYNFLWMLHDSRPHGYGARV